MGAACMSFRILWALETIQFRIGLGLQLLVCFCNQCFVRLVHRSFDVTTAAWREAYVQPAEFAIE